MEVTIGDRVMDKWYLIAAAVIVGAIVGYFAGQYTGGESALLGAIVAALILNLGDKR
jgi:hypothetical protein